MSVITNTQAQKQLENSPTAEWRRRRQEHSRTVNYSKTVDQTEVSRNETVLKELIFCQKLHQASSATHQRRTHSVQQLNEGLK